MDFEIGPWVIGSRQLKPTSKDRPLKDIVGAITELGQQPGMRQQLIGGIPSANNRGLRSAVTLAKSRSLNYIWGMNFEWDDDKSLACYQVRGFDFAYAAFAFADPDRLVRQDHRFSYGEDRYELLGRIEGRLYVLIYTPRYDGIRIISARKANPREVKRYENRSNED